MPKLEIKAEKLANRCEICHQMDLYDPKENYCIRCEKVLAENKAKSVLRKEPNLFSWVEEIKTIILSLAYGGIIGSGFLGLLFFIGAIYFPNEISFCFIKKAPPSMGSFGSTLGLFMGSFLGLSIRLFYSIYFRRKDFT
jgi:hypothetical protein